MFQRYDSAKIDSFESLSNGYLRIKAKPTRVGVFLYQDSFGNVRRELRSSEEVFKEDSKKTLGNSVLTDNHPPVFLNSENTKSFFSGWVISDNIQDDGEYITAEVVIADSEAINKALNGKVELSCGYTCSYDYTPGTYKGQQYDVAQKDIKYNHVSIVDKGRMGPDARLYFDSKTDVKDFEIACQIIDSIQDKQEETKGNDQMKIEELMDKISVLEKEKQTLSGKCDALEAENNKKDEQIKQLQTKTDSDAINSIVAELIEARTFAAKFDSELNVDKLDSFAIKKAIVSKHLGDKARLDSADYVTAAYDIIVSQFDSQAAASSATEIGKTIKNDSGAASQSLEAIRAAQIEKQRNKNKEI